MRVHFPTLKTDKSESVTGNLRFKYFDKAKNNTFISKKKQMLGGEEKILPQRKDATEEKIANEIDSIEEVDLDVTEKDGGVPEGLIGQTSSVLQRQPLQTRQQRKKNLIDYYNKMWNTYLETDYEKDSDVEIDEVKTNNRHRNKTKTINMKQLETAVNEVVCLSSEDEGEINVVNTSQSLKTTLCKKNGKNKVKKSVRFGMDILKVRLQ